jgi:uncharacterized repeat protein (TIGR01451 family)
MKRAILLLTAMGAMLVMYTGQVLADHIPPDLVARYHQGPSQVPAGTQVRYYAYVENNGGRTATVPDGTVVATHTLTGTTSTSCEATTGYSCRGIGTVEIVAVGEQTIGVGGPFYSTVYADAPATTGKITHSMTADPNGVIEEIDEGNNTSDTITTYVGDAPATDLSVTQTDSLDPVGVGRDLQYYVTVTNNGQDTAFNVLLENTLSANAPYQYAFGGDNYIFRGCNFISIENTVICPLGEIPSGESRTLVIHVKVNAAGTVSNTATVVNDNGDPEPSNDTAKEETTVRPETDTPTITDLKPKKGSEKSDRTPLIKATVSDDETDLAQAGTVRIYLDDKEVEGSYDGSLDKLSYTPSKKLAYGRHTVRVVATDENGNQAERAWRFKVVKK